MRTIKHLRSIFPHLAEKGLSGSDVETSGERFGRNVLTPLPRESAWVKFLAKFDDPIIRILLAASLLSMSVDLFRAEGAEGYLTPLLFTAAVITAFVVTVVSRQTRFLPLVFLGSALFLLIGGAATGHLLYEGLAVMIAVLLATGVAFYSEHKSDREFELLNESKESQRVKVMRGGITLTVPAEEVVTGDLVVLGTGDEIPADGRVLVATELRLDQSLMNGESEPAQKYAQPEDRETGGPDQAGCLYRGTYVVSGIGTMIVTEVGDETEFGKIARKLAGAADEPEDDAGGRVRGKLTISKEPTPLQRKLTVLADTISRLGYAAAATIFAVLLVRGALMGELRLPAGAEAWGPVLIDNLSVLLTYVVYVVIIIVVAVPEGLPMSVTVSLALAMRKMTRNNSLVRQLVACETIGSATIICSDKTGTLTQNKMQVEKVGVDGRWYVNGEAELQPGDIDPKTMTPLRWVALISAVNSTSYLEEKAGKIVTVGNSTEGALLQWLAAHGVSYGELRARHKPLVVWPFSSDEKRMTSVIEIGGSLIVLAKGAPERILAACPKTMCDDGTISEWSADEKKAVEGMLHEATKEAMRTLAFAVAVLPAKTVSDPEKLRAARAEVERDLTYLGFAAIRDPLRPDVQEAIDECRSAGIKVQMITGDTIETARAIGRDIGLLADKDDLVLTSADFNAMTDDELLKVMPRLRILARAQPLDKLRMVKLHQRRGEVVAVTGDGTNDAPALKQADVGLAMGRAGTEVAKEASKIILLDDAFATIVKAVFWGRALYENIQRFIQFQLTINASALGIAFLAPFFGLQAPFTVLQFLWINVIMDTFASLALCSEPPRRELMQLPPKKRDEPILTPQMRVNLLLTAGFYVVVMVGLLLLMRGTPDAPGLFAGASEWLREETGVLTGFTLRQATIFFTVYVIFQVWNMFNCRSIRVASSGLRNPFANRMMLGILALILVCQVLIVTFGGTIFQVEPLGLADWLWIGAGTFTVVAFSEVTRLIRLGLSRPASLSPLSNSNRAH